MKRSIAALLFAACFPLIASAFPRAGYHMPRASTYKARSSYGGPVHTRGYIKQDGTYVAPHYQTAPNRTKTDNWSSKPNVNPYTGQPGTVDPYAPGH